MNSRLPFRHLFFFMFFTLLIVTQAEGQAVTTSGISVQGIARDAEKAAIGDKLMNFAFEILHEGTSYYKEGIQIKTDAYGVFSHIIGTGDIVSGSGNFNEIPFSQKLMKLVITVTYQGNTVEVSNAPFQFTPYAKAAENGVPTGTIVAFAGKEKDVPVGWTLCDGKALGTVPGSLNLINLIGDNAPNLKGMFLRGTGQSPVNSQAGPALGDTQSDEFESHRHAASDDNGAIVTATDGAHRHTIKLDRHNRSFEGNDDTDLVLKWNEGVNISYETGKIEGDDPSDDRKGSDEGAHAHSIRGNTAASGGAETRPVNYGVNYIIKL
jgi:hypothetical protein